jgi:hypothetical protein
VAGSCEDSNERLVFIKIVEFIQLNLLINFIKMEYSLSVSRIDDPTKLSFGRLFLLLSVFLLLYVILSSTL